MKWQDLMIRFAEVIGRVLAERWLAEQSPSGQQEVETDDKVTEVRRDRMVKPSLPACIDDVPENGR